MMLEQFHKSGYMSENILIHWWETEMSYVYTDSLTEIMYASLLLWSQYVEVHFHW